MGALLLDVGGRNDLSGEVKPLAEVVETLGGQGVVVVLPGELGLDIAAGGEGLASLDDEEVLGVDIGVLGEVVVLLRDEDTLAEEVLLNFHRQHSRRRAYGVQFSSRAGEMVILTSWIFLRSALGINIVAVVGSLAGRCWGG